MNVNIFSSQVSSISNIKDYGEFSLSECFYFKQFSKKIECYIVNFTNIDNLQNYKKFFQKLIPYSKYTPTFISSIIDKSPSLLFEKFSIISYPESIKSLINPLSLKLIFEFLMILKREKIFIGNLSEGHFVYNNKNKLKINLLDGINIKYREFIEGNKSISVINFYDKLNHIDDNLIFPPEVKIVLSKDGDRNLKLSFHKIDIFMLGVVFFKRFCDMKKIELNKVFNNQDSINRNIKTLNCPEWFKPFLRRMLRINSDSRKSSFQLMKKLRKMLELEIEYFKS